MTIEEKLKMVIGEQVFIIASLSVQLDEAQKEIAALKASNVKEAKE